MSLLGKIVVAIAALFCVGATVFFSHRTGFTQLLTAPLFLLFLIAILIGIICIFVDWRERKWKALLPLATCFLSPFIASKIANPIREAIFTKCLPSYEAVVHQMESGEILVSTNLSKIPEAVPKARMAYAVFAQKDTNGVLTVEFWTEGGFPVLHSGYLYSSSGVVNPGSEAGLRWPIRVQERPKWFYISD